MHLTGIPIDILHIILLLLNEDDILNTMSTSHSMKSLLHGIDSHLFRRVLGMLRPDVIIQRPTNIPLCYMRLSKSLDIELHASYGYHEEVNILLANGASSTRIGLAFVLACKIGHIGIVRDMLDKSDPRLPCSRKSTFWNSRTSKERLYKNSPMWKFKGGTRIPFYSAVHNGHHEIIRLFYTSGIRCKTYARHALNSACKDGSMEMVRALLLHCCDGEARSSYSILISAYDNGTLECLMEQEEFVIDVPWCVEMAAQRHRWHLVNILHNRYCSTISEAWCKIMTRSINRDHHRAVKYLLECWNYDSESLKKLEDMALRLDKNQVLDVIRDVLMVKHTSLPAMAST